MTLEEIKEQVASDDNFHNWESLFEGCAMYDYGRLENAIDKVAERYAQSQTQELTDWKESMMKVHSELDLQGIGTALELPLGSSIAPQVLPKIKELKEQNAELIEALQNVANLLDSDSQISVESIKRVLTKYNHLKSNANG